MLAFACAFTMFAGAASFTDEADINADNRDAVELLTALNIIQGYEDGSFDPSGTVTRAEMAKMIYTIRNGGNDDASAYESVTTSFTDISGHWAEGYIKYLQNTGIVAGKSATRFDPDSQVTTGEAMKMALVLAGYRADEAGLTGASWLNNTVARATTVGMTEDVNSAIAGGCTRQDAAQILSNTLTEVEAVLWSEFVSDFVYDGTNGLATGNRQSVGAKWMDLVIETGFITGAPSSKTNPKGITFVDEDGDPHTFRNATQDVSDLLGYEVKVVWDADKVNDAEAIYGIYKTADNESFETVWKDVEKDGAKVKFDGKSYELDGTINVYADRSEYDWTSANFDKLALADAVTFIDNDGDGKIDAAQVKTQNVTKVTYVGSSNMDTNGLIATNKAYAPFNPYDTDPDLSDVNTYEGIAKNDYAKVSYDYYNNKVTYEKIDAVEAKVEATRTTGTNTKEIRIDGTWYKPAAGYNTMPSIVSGDTISYIAIDTLLYNVEKIDGTWGSKSLAVVYDVAQYNAGTRANELEISLITRDGTKKTAFLDKYNNVEVTVANTVTPTWNIGGSAKNLVDVQTLLEGKLVTYREDGSEISLMPVSTTQKAGYDDVYAVKATSTDGVEMKNIVTTAKNGTGTADTTINIADDAVVFLWTAAGDASVLTGKELANAATTGMIYKIDAGNVALGGEVNGANYIQAVAIKTNKMPTTTGSNYAYVLSAAETVDNDDYRYFELWTSAGKLEAYEESSVEYTYNGGEIVTYEVVSTTDGKTIIKDVELAANVKIGAITSDGFYGTNDNSISIGGTKKDLTSDATILNVDTDAKEGYNSEAPKSSARAAKAGTLNILYVENQSDASELEFVLIDGLNNQIKNWPAMTALSNSATDINAALATADVVTAGTPGAGEITIPAGKTLNITSNVNAGTTFVGGGKIAVTGTVADTSQISTAATLSNNMTLPAPNVTLGVMGGNIGSGSELFASGDYTGKAFYQFTIPDYQTGCMLVSVDGTSINSTINSANDLIGTFTSGQTRTIVIDPDGAGSASSVTYVVTAPIF